MAAGKYRSPGMPSAVQTKTPTGKHAAEARTFAGTPLTVDGITREALGSSSLLGSAIPKGIAASTIGASHAGAASDLTQSQAAAQADIQTSLAQLAVISKARAMRSVARNAEAVPATSTALNVQSPRLLAHGRGPLVLVMALMPGDIARVSSMFARYGYTINRAFVPSQLNTMSRYTYWQTAGAVILGAVPQNRRQTIQAAFDRGVTIWENVADIGTQPTNTPLPGITY